MVSQSNVILHLQALMPVFKKFQVISGLMVLIGCVIKRQPVYFPTARAALAAMFSGPA